MSASELPPAEKGRVPLEIDFDKGIVDPEYQYLRIFLEDPEAADELLELVVDDPVKRADIRSEAERTVSIIGKTKTAGGVNIDNIRKALEEYKSRLSEALNE